MTRTYDEWTDGLSSTDFVVDGHQLEVAYYEMHESRNGVSFD